MSVLRIAPVLDDDVGVRFKHADHLLARRNLLLVQLCFCKFEFIRPGARAERLAKVSEDRRRVLRGYITSNLEGVKKNGNAC